MPRTAKVHAIRWLTWVWLLLAGCAVNPVPTPAKSGELAVDQAQDAAGGVKADKDASEPSAADAHADVAADANGAADVADVPADVSASSDATSTGDVL